MKRHVLIVTRRADVLSPISEEFLALLRETCVNLPAFELAAMRQR